MGHFENLSDGTIIMPIGLPASGKSTFYDRLKDMYGARLLRVSFDDAVNALADNRKCSYGEAYQMVQDDDLAKRFVENHYEAQIYLAQSEGTIVYIDQTNTSRKQRAKMLDNFPSYQTKIAVYFDMTAQESVDRCRHRFFKTGKNVPLQAVYRMANSLQDNMPDLDEFDQIITIDPSRRLLPHASLSHIVKTSAHKAPKP